MVRLARCRRPLATAGSRVRRGPSTSAADTRADAPSELRTPTAPPPCRPRRFSEGSFESTIQSLFICVSGGMTKALRKKTSGESSHSLSETINQIMNNDKKATEAAK